MLRSRFFRVWLLWSALYVGLAVLGPNGLVRSPVWPVISQHLLQTRAWLGVDIEIPIEGTDEVEVVPVSPRLDVTPYFKYRPVRDPRENGVVSNLAVAVPDGNGGLAPIQDRWGIGGRRPDAESLVCQVGFPPGPSMLLLPFVLILRSLVATQWLSALLGGLGVASVDRLGAAWIARLFGSATDVGRNQLMLVAGAGTLWVWIVPDGGTFLFAQTVGSTALTVALLAASRHRFFLAGISYGLAITSRPAMLGALPLVLVLAAMAVDEMGFTKRRSRLRALIEVCIGPALFGSIALILNFLRFGSIAQFGYSFMIVPPLLRERLLEHGQISLHYLGRNIQAVFFQAPMVIRDESGALSFPFVASDPVGMGLLFVTPAYVLLALAWGGRERSGWLLGTCWLSLLLTCLPGLLYYNTGWVQWGGRFLVDAWPMWLLLAAAGFRRVPRSLTWVLVVLSVVCSGWAVLLTLTGVWPGCCS